ncbi:MAG: hypothetical protein IH621_11080 [Krumholzibacteria bacterium]|nr:hypothetical protein [Candidatus Krumholzibacteria bacterium]
MTQAPQTALERYKARRAGLEVGPLLLPDPARAPRRRPAGLGLRLAVLGTALAVLAVALLAARPRDRALVDLSYAIDLAAAPQGTLVIAVEAAGDLPRELDLAFPPGIFGDVGNGVTPHSPRAEARGPEAAPRPLPVEPTADGWRVTTGGAGRVRFTYRVDLARVRGLEQDIRRHISTPVTGGLRAAGFEVFLTPVGVDVRDIVVRLDNPGELPVLVPWPSLVTRGGGPAAAGGRPLLPPARPAGPEQRPAGLRRPAHPDPDGARLRDPVRHRPALALLRQRGP